MTYGCCILDSRLSPDKSAGEVTCWRTTSSRMLISGTQTPLQQTELEVPGISQAGGSQRATAVIARPALSEASTGMPDVQEGRIDAPKSTEQQAGAHNGYLIELLR